VLKNGSRSVRINNPTARTRYSAELKEELIGLLGPDGVQVRVATATVN
jgi:hypothetical protein